MLTGCVGVLGLGEVREVLDLLPLRALTGGDTFSWFSVFPLLEGGLPLFLTTLGLKGVWVEVGLATIGWGFVVRVALPL